MKRTKYEPDVMINAVQDYLDRQTSQQAIADRFGLALASFQGWIWKSGTLTQDRNKHCSKDRKGQAAADYLTVQFSSPLLRCLFLHPKRALSGS